MSKTMSKPLNTARSPYQERSNFQFKSKPMDSAYSSNELERIAELRRYAILDTQPEAEFHDFTKLAASICATPISLVSLVDSERIWFKSKVGVAASEIPRIDGFCSSAILNETLLIIPDASANKKLSSHPLVTSDPKVRFYAGAPLITPRGHRIGTLCVMDTVPRQINAVQSDALESLARTVITQLEYRRSMTSYAKAQQELLNLQARTETDLREQTDKLALRNESLRNLSGQLIRAQDDERRRIARELHDSTGQVLAALSMTIGRMHRESSSADLRGFQECKNLLASAIDEIRNLSYLLHPPLMDELGLASAVAEYARGFQKRSGISIEVEVSQELGRLNADREIALFRIIQESIGNVHRHSGSATAFVKISRVENDVVVEIRDQGQGLPNGSGEITNFGVGIRSMQERLRPFGGTLKVESNGSGTKVTAVLRAPSTPQLSSAQTA